MGEKSNISWTNSSWNPVTGCSKVSEGCRHCYAETLSLRMGWSEKPWAAAYAAENVVLHPDRVGMPLRWKKPRMIFVNSMSDVFHEQIPVAFVEEMFGIMALAPQHTFQILTKRPERMRWFMANACHNGHLDGDDPLPNVWLGTSVENQRAADERIPHLMATPAAVRFLSCEPLLGSLDLSRFLIPGCPSCGRLHLGDADHPRGGALGWVIVGGESGNHLGDADQDARWMDPRWAREIRDQCVSAGVPFFFKQSSGKRPGMHPYIIERDHRHTEWHQFPEVAHAVRTAE